MVALEPRHAAHPPPLKTLAEAVELTQPMHPHVVEPATHTPPVAFEPRVSGASHVIAAQSRLERTMPSGVDGIELAGHVHLYVGGPGGPPVCAVHTRLGWHEGTHCCEAVRRTRSAATIRAARAPDDISASRRVGKGCARARVTRARATSPRARY